jgi:hypothetical protein
LYSSGQITKAVTENTAIAGVGLLLKLEFGQKITMQRNAKVWIYGVVSKYSAKDGGINKKFIDNLFKVLVINKVYFFSCMILDMISV